jgi:hypothetical protein
MLRLYVEIYHRPSEIRDSNHATGPLALMDLIRVFAALLDFVGIVSFFNLTHVWVPISLSPLVAFAPAGDREMGTEERSRFWEQSKKRLIVNEERSGD